MITISDLQGLLRTERKAVESLLLPSVQPATVSTVTAFPEATALLAVQHDKVASYCIFTLARTAPRHKTIQKNAMCETIHINPIFLKTYLN